MKTQYRNAIRSQTMIKKAFIELLKEKPANKITVTDIINKADISRGTFYLHFQDTLDLLDSFQRDFFNQLIVFINKNNENLLVDKIDLLLQKTLKILKDDIETYRILANKDFTFTFYKDIKDVLLNELMKGYNVDDETKRSLNIYVSGFTLLLREWLENPEIESMEELTKTLSRLIHQGTLI